MDKKIISYSFLIILFLMFTTSFTEGTVEIEWASAAEPGQLDYIAGLSGERPRAAYTTKITSEGETVGEVFVVNFANSRSCQRAQDTFVNIELSRGAKEFERIVGKNKITVMKGIDYAFCIMQKGRRLIYARADNSDLATGALLAVKVKTEGTKQALGILIFIALAAGIFLLIKFSPNLALAEKIKLGKKVFVSPQIKAGPKINVGPKLKLGPEIKVEPKIGIAPKIKLVQEGPKVKMQEEREKPGPKIKFGPG